VELTYKIGTHSKFQYFSGEYSPKEYTQIWQSLLTPLLDCGDWFMNPCSFVLDAEHLYFDKNGKNIIYVYVPTIRGWSGYDAFNVMITEISKMISVSDSVLENKVLRAVIDNINPTEFIKMLKDHLSENENAAQAGIAEAPAHTAMPETSDAAANKNVNDETGINLLAASKGCDSDEDKPSMQSAQTEEEDIFIDILPNREMAEQKPEKETGRYRMFSSRSRRKKAKQDEKSLKDNSKPIKRTRKSKPPQEMETMQQLDAAQQPDIKMQSANEPIVEPYAVQQSDIIDITQITSIALSGPGFRYIGNSHLPQAIEIAIAEGEMFSIGRFDANVGKQQSSFEFDKRTRAVSRRHAVIERDIAGYKIVDLSSSAGTFVNNQKLPPNTPHGLETGFRVSFGNSGADYVWEVS